MNVITELNECPLGRAVRMIGTYKTGRIRGRSFGGKPRYDIMLDETREILTDRYRSDFEVL